MKCSPKSLKDFSKVGQIFEIVKNTFININHLLNGLFHINIIYVSIKVHHLI